MKYIKLIFILLCATLIAQKEEKNNQITTQNAWETIQVFVSGNCSMCKSAIEKAVNRKDEAYGSWDKDTKILNLKFNTSKTSIQKVMNRVAAAGYDNTYAKADDEAYKNRPDCCQYDREEMHKLMEKIKKEQPKDFNFFQSLENSSENEEDWLNYKEEGIALATVSLQGSKANTALNTKSAGLTFDIDAKELLKAACCNLSESFETNATVDVSFSNAITGTKQMKMLGLDQKYTLFTKELLPEIRGLATTYGMSFLPGRWISGLQLTKGGSSVVNGYESIAGQINIELLKGFKNKKTNLNFYADAQTRAEINIVHADSISPMWSQTILAHADATLERQDYNKDNFIDQPIGRQLNIGYLLDFNDLENSGWGTHFGLNILNGHSLAGEMDFIPSKDKGTQNAYGVGIDINRFQTWNKTGYVFDGKPYQSIGFMNQFTYHEQQSYFGQKPYEGIQKTYYTNLIFESIFSNTNHKYKLGASFMWDNFEEGYQSQNFSRTEKVPGAFFEYTYTGNKLTAVAGLRTDLHNLAGVQVSPRLNIKYDLFSQSTLRLSGGRGFRTANIFAESQAYMASNRNIIVSPNKGEIYGLKPEIAWNYGVSFHQQFRILGNKSSIILDYFRTDFQNQILPDLDTSPQEILFYNSNRNSFAHSFQIQWDFEPIDNLELRFAYKNYKTQYFYNGKSQENPFTPKHRGFINLAYQTYANPKGQFWDFDTTIQWVGTQRIPSTASNPVAYQLPEYSKPYFIWNAQVAREFGKKIRIYTGVENILSEMQNQPILDEKNPFGSYFDGGMVYAPIMPANFYIGLDVNF